MTDELSQDRIGEIANEALAKIDQYLKGTAFKIEIPNRLQDPAFRFILVDKKSKKPTEVGWPMYTFNHPRLVDHLSRGGNYGVRPGEGEIGILDADNPDRLRELGVLTVFDDSFFVSNRDDGRGHHYFLCDNPPWKKLILQDPERVDVKGDHLHLGELYAGVGNYQVVGPGSLHPEGRIYKVKKDVPLRRFTHDELENIFSVFVRREIPPEYARKTRVEKLGTVTDRLNLRVEDFLMPDNPVRHGDEIQGAHPIHGSETGMNLRLNTRQGVWYCFRHETGGDALLAFAVREGIIRCDDATPGTLKDAKRMSEVHQALVTRGLIKEGIPPLKEDNKDTAVKVDSFNCTHYGNGLRFVNWYGNTVRYCPPFDWWYVWNQDEGRWARDEMGTILELGKETVIRLYGEAEKAGDKKRREELALWAIKCEKPTSVNMLLDSAKSDPLITVHFSKFDPDPMQLNLKNGWYDFKEMIFHEHDKDRFFTMMIPVEYDPSARCPIWLAFLDRIFKGHVEKEKLTAFLQRAVGYTLTGDTRERAIFLMHGLGANGKTVFISTLESLFGDYGASVSSTTFTTAMSTNVRNDLARLKGKRFVWASENSSETVLDEELIKRITGGDTVTCRFLFKEEFEYRPNFHIWWIFNHKPKIRDSTDSIWDRINLVPCDERIPKAEQDKSLTEKLAKELPGILNWALEGYKQYRVLGDNLTPPEQVVAATKEYRQSEDVLAEFIQEMLEEVQQATLGDGLSLDTRTPFSLIWEAWKSYTAANGEKSRSKQWLGRKLEDKYKKYRTNAEKGFLGVKVKYSSPPP